MEDLKQIPPTSIESDAPSEYMRGYSDGLAQAEEIKADAARYRFMRDCDGSINAARHISLCDERPRYEEVEWFYDDELDAVIDAEMSANENDR